MRAVSFDTNNAKGAQYDSQGQARSASPLDDFSNDVEPWKGRNTTPIISAFQALSAPLGLLSRGDVLASLRTCPWLSYSAPLALCGPSSILTSQKSLTSQEC